jgi:hypothetical protein
MQTNEGLELLYLTDKPKQHITELLKIFEQKRQNMVFFNVFRILDQTSRKIKLKI